MPQSPSHRLLLQRLSAGRLPTCRISWRRGALRCAARPSAAAAAEEESDIARDVTINDAPPQTRYTLTKRTTQEEIQRRTATVIVNR